MITPKDIFRTETVHRSISNDPLNGLIDCGFLLKKGGSCVEHIKFDYYGCLLVLNGEGIHTDGEGNRFRIKPGCFVQRIPGKVHGSYIEHGEQWLEFFICFGKELFDSLANIGLLDRYVDVYNPGVSIQRIFEFESLLKKAKICDERDLGALLMEAVRLVIDLTRSGRAEYGDLHVLDFINRHKTNHAIHEGAIDYCKMVGVGYEAFRKKFKKEMGVSPMEYVNSMRIDKAKTMLLEGKLNVSEISRELGYSDAYAFSKYFKKTVGRSPLYFKKTFL